VASVFVSRCAPCHYAGNPAVRFPLQGYAQVSGLSGSCLDQVYTCRMPPADAGTAFVLSAAERKDVLTWLVCGAPNN